MMSISLLSKTSLRVCVVGLFTHRANDPASCSWVIISTARRNLVSGMAGGAISRSVAFTEIMTNQAGGRHTSCP